jgi:PTS system nitrogen regulatory IIA component
MNITNLIAPERVSAGSRAGNKAQLLQELARHAAEYVGMTERVILDALNAREQLGSTGIGEGIAIPHARIKGLSHFFGLFTRLERPIDFGAIDGRPVDLVFLLLSPEASSGDHLAALACVSRRLHSHEIARSLRATNDPRQLYRLLTNAGIR